MFQQFHLNQTQLNHCTTKFEFYQGRPNFPGAGGRKYQLPHRFHSTGFFDHPDQNGREI